MRQPPWYSWTEFGWIVALLAIVMIGISGIALGAYSQATQTEQRSKLIRKLEIENAVLKERVRRFGGKRR